MKRLFFALTALMILAVAADSQVQPNGPGSRPTVQYSRSKMRRGPHDFTADSGMVKGASIRLCGYCHTPHVPVTGISAPLWARKSIVGRAPASYGTYSNPVSLDASVADIKTSDNYSSFCMSCHDGSSLFALSSYEKRPRAITGGVYDTTLTVDAEFNLYNGGEYALTHTHPVNFDYNATLASQDGNLFTPATASYVYMDNTTSPPTAVGRLFNGTMQCSSCHNPHMSSGIGIQGSNDYSKLCIACHQK
jgi:predicted CXXCH cytochrome family protein